MKRFLALALSVLMILGVLLMAGCNTTGNGDSSSSTSKKPTGTNSTTGGNTDVDDTTTGEGGGSNEINYYGKMPGYEDIDFGGETFIIYGADGESDGFNSAKEIYSEESDAISVAVRERNALIELLYNCTVKGESRATPAGDVGTEITSNIKNGADLYTHHYAISSVATEGKAYNLLSYGSRAIDFSKVWWDQQYVNSYTVKNSAGQESLYSIVGDFALTTFDCTHAIVYNKTVYQNTAAIKDIDVYQLVRDKKWTMDQFEFMIKAATVNNGTQELNVSGNEGDILGWIRTGHATHGLHTASGLSIIKNTDGVFTFEVDKNAASWTTVMDRACALWAIPEGQTIGYSSIPGLLAGGYALFASEILGSSLGNLKDYDAEIGLLPYPLYSETQENYAHYVDNHVYSYSIPVSCDHPDTVVDFLAVYAFHSTGIVRPAYINVYAYDYCADPDSYEMLDIILSTMTYDPGYLSASLEAEISNMITNNGNKITQFASKKAATANKWITNFIAGIDDNEI